jgi:hypothetical protein
MVLLILKIRPFNLDLQVISQSTIHTRDETEVPYFLIEVAKEYTLVVIFSFFFIN